MASGFPSCPTAAAGSESRGSTWLATLLPASFGSDSLYSSSTRAKGLKLWPGGGGGEKGGQELEDKTLGEVFDQLTFSVKTGKGNRKYD